MMPGFFHQNTDYNAVDLRQIFTTRYNSDGIVGGSGGWKATATGVNELTVDPGYAVISHSSPSAGRFLIQTTANTVLSGMWTAPGSGNVRRWLVYAQLNDSSLSGSGTDNVQIFVTDGVAGRPSPNTASSPSLPSTPTNAIPLLDVSMTSSATLLTATKVDIRKIAEPEWNSPWGVVAANIGATSAWTGVYSVPGGGVSTYPSLLPVTFKMYPRRLYHFHMRVAMGVQQPVSGGSPDVGSWHLLARQNGTSVKDQITPSEYKVDNTMGGYWITNDYFDWHNDATPRTVLADAVAYVTCDHTTQSYIINSSANRTNANIITDHGPIRTQTVSNGFGGNIWTNT